MPKSRSTKPNYKKCQNVWLPTPSDNKNFRKGYVWQCFCCSRLRKTLPASSQKLAG